MKIVSWNVNSVKARHQHLVDWLREQSPDIVLLQELKCSTETFPTEEIEDLGYNLAIHGQKSYNGVAIASKFPLEDITTSFINDPDPSHSRYIEALVSVKPGLVMRVASIYVPNGQEVGSDKFLYKLKFLDALHHHIRTLLNYDEIMILGGDFNVAPENIDVYNPKLSEGSVCFNLEERSRFRKILNLGMIDAYRTANPTSQDFTWWDYRAGAFEHNFGLRIDHLLLSPEACDLLLNCTIIKELRSKAKSSDHAPILVELKV
jgi:exodeoxyribonuclease-3